MANISFISIEFPAGGTERVTINLARPLTDMGHKIYLFVYKLDKEKLPANLPIEYIELPYPSNNAQNFDTIVEAITRYNIEVFFSPAIYPRFMPKLYATGLCKIVHVLHSCPFYEDIAQWHNIMHPNKGSLKSIVKNYLIRYPKYKLGYYHRRTLRHYKRKYANVDAYGVLFDTYGRQIASTLGVDYASSKLVTLRNPIEPCKQCDTPVEREKIVAYVGRLSRYDKRVDRLLDVWHRLHAKFPEWRLWIVGSGDDQPALEEYAAQNNLCNVEFLGYRSEVDDIYRKVSIVCLTSNFEGCPMVLLEAQEYGCATIAFECSSGVREILSPNMINGACVPNGDIDAYTEALARLMEDDELRHTIQQNGVENAKSFAPQISAQQYNDLIERLLAK